MVLFNGVGNVFKNTFNKVGNFFKNLPDSVRGVGNSLKSVGNWLNDKWNDFTGITANNANLEFQRENLDYLKALQQQVFEREDSAHQRTVNDMRMSGLNPLSMNGTNGAGEAIATSPIETQKTSDLQAINEILNVMNQVSVTRNNSTLSNAQSNLINAQAENQRIKNLYESDILGKTLEGINFTNIGKQFENERSNIAWLNERRNYFFNKQFGISDNMPEFAKIINYATHQGNLPKDFYKDFNREWSNLGKTFNDWSENPDFNNLQGILEKSNLKGALQENVIGNALLSLLGIK